MDKQMVGGTLFNEHNFQLIVARHVCKMIVRYILTRSQYTVCSFEIFK